MESVISFFNGDTHPHLLLAVMLLFVIILAWLLQRIGLPIVLRLTQHMLVVHAMLRNMDRALSYVLPLLLMQFVLRGAPDDMTAIEGLRQTASVLLILALTWLLVSAVKGVAETMSARYRIDIDDNLHARSVLTQTRVLTRTLMVVIILLGFSAVLMSFPAVRTVGAGLLASAGVAGLAIGMAAKPVLGNLIAGIQIALTQPMRIDDVLVVEGEFGKVEEITGTYIVLAIWDKRRLIVPLQWFIEHPFQNWTRQSADIIGSILWWVDYRMPLEPIRQEVRRLCETAPQWWDGELANLQVVEVSEKTMQIRALVSAGNAGKTWDLRCHVRAGVIDFIQREYPQYLPHLRAEFGVALPVESAAK